MPRVRILYSSHCRENLCDARCLKLILESEKPYSIGGRCKWLNGAPDTSPTVIIASDGSVFSVKPW